MQIEKNVALFIQSQFPAIYRESGLELVKLVEEYYKFLETETNQSIYNIRRIFEYRDISTTLSSMIIFFHKMFMADLPLSEENTKIIIKNIIGLYRRKGTEGGIKLFFRIFYQEDVEVYYPAKQMIKPSSSKWRTGTYLQMIPNDGIFTSTSGETYQYSDLIGKNIVGSFSQARAAVNKINFIMINGIITPIIYIDEVKGTFQKYDDIITNIKGLAIAFGRINGSANEFNVDSNFYARTTGNRVGDILNIESEYGVGGKVIVTKISNEITGQITYSVTNGGFGYTYDNTRLLVSNQTIVLPNSELSFIPLERLQDSAGNLGTVIGQSADAVGVKMDTGDSFAISRPISTLDRTPNITLSGIVRISAKNETSPGDLYPDTANTGDVRVGELINSSNVSLITDVISNFTSVTINAANYNDPPALVAMSGNTDPITLSTPLNQAFDLEPFEIGSIRNFVNINPGAGYINDVFALAIDDTLAGFERYGQIITFTIPASAGSFTIGEIISESNTSITAVVNETNSTDGYIKITPFSYYGFSGTNSVIKSNGESFSVLNVETDYESKKFGENAIVRSTTGFADGVIEEVKVINSGLGYVDGAAGNLVDDNGSIEAAGIISAVTQGTTSGYWSDLSSHINGYREAANSALEYFDSGTRVQDSDYYQEYSYQVKSTLSPNEYESFLKETVHLAGTKLFGQFSYKAKATLGTRARFLRLFNDQAGQGSPLDKADPNQLTSDILNFTVDSTVPTVDSVPS